MKMIQIRSNEHHILSKSLSVYQPVRFSKFEFFWVLDPLILTFEVNDNIKLH